MVGRIDEIGDDPRLPRPAEPEPSVVWVIDCAHMDPVRVVGVFSSRANAEAVLAELDLSDASISKWPMDPGVGEVNAGRSTFWVTMLADGQGTARHKHYGVPGNLAISKPLSKKYPQQVFGAVWATDEAHALKIANEFRVRAIAEGRMRQWGDDDA
jgi:hypothetical protein